MESWLAFKIWYADNSTFTGQSYTDWLNAPTDSMQVVIFYLSTTDNTGYPEQIVYKGVDYVAMDEHGGVTSQVGSQDGLVGQIITGSNMDFDAYVALLETAQADNGSPWLVPVIPLPPTVKEGE